MFVAVMAVVAFVAATALGYGPLYQRMLTNAQKRERKPSPARPASPPPTVTVTPSVQLLTRKRRSRVERDAEQSGSPSEQLEEVLSGAVGPQGVSRAIRIATGLFILAVLLLMFLGQLWTDRRPEIFATLAAGGAFVLVAHEFLPPALGARRLAVEGTAAMVFLTVLIALTGGAQSPFFIVYAAVIAGIALVASPLVTVLLTLEAAIAYAVAGLYRPIAGPTSSDDIARLAVNFGVMLIMALIGTTLARMQRRTHEAAIKLSTIDALTGLSNRAYFYNVVDREIRRSRRFGRGFCLLMMDLDGLKAINDRYGHHAGDLMLRAMGNVICSNLRAVDVPARYGGDEFVALLPETDSTGAFVVAEKIRMGAAELTVESGGLSIRSSISIGVVSFPEDGRSADELMITADEAMYASKRLGKNRVVGYAEPTDTSAPFVSSRRQVVSTPGFWPLGRDAESAAERLSRDRIPWDREDRPDDFGGPGDRAGPGERDRDQPIDFPRDLARDYPRPLGREPLNREALERERDLLDREMFDRERERREPDRELSRQREIERLDRERLERIDRDRTERGSK